jgi:hypothetical protein
MQNVLLTSQSWTASLLGNSLTKPINADEVCDHGKSDETEAIVKSNTGSLPILQWSLTLWQTGEQQEITLQCETSLSIRSSLQENLKLVSLPLQMK